MSERRMQFVVAAGLCAAAWVWAWQRLPERVPTHFGAGGNPDAWSTRAGALWTTGLLSIGTTALFLGLVWLILRTSAEHINVPNPDYWKRPERLGRLRELLAEDIRLIGAWTLLLLAAVQFLVVRAAALTEPRLDGWAVVAVGGYLVAVVGRTVWMLTRRYAVPRPG